MLSEEYLGRTICYNEDDDVWRVFSDDIEGASLKVVKAKIREIDEGGRPVGVIAILNNPWGKIENVTTTMLTADRRGVWVMGKNGRQNVNLRDVVADTPENRAAFQKVQEIEAKRTALAQEAWALFVSIPRMTAEEFLERQKTST